MNTQTLYPGKFVHGSGAIVCALQSFGTLLRAAMGEGAWSRLVPAIRARFAGYISEDQPLWFRGRMHWVYCSPVGALVMRLLSRYSILPARCARDCEFDFQIGLQQGEIVKQRRYQLDQARQFVFRSRFSDMPVLHEEFAGGIGMYLELSETRGGLLFRDRGYYWRVWRWRLPLPHWLCVGRFELLHRNLDAGRYQIIIRVAHPLLGTLFYQRGVFRSETS